MTASQAGVYLSPHLRLHPPTPRFHHRHCGRPPYVPHWLRSAVRVHSRDWSFPERLAAPRLPGLKRHRYFLLSALRCQYRDSQFAHRCVAEHGFCIHGGWAASWIFNWVGGRRRISRNSGVAVGYYIFAILVAIYGQPKSRRDRPVTWQRIAYEIDWVGVMIPSTALAILSYVLA